MAEHPFGNDSAKIEGYRRFWSRDPVDRPLIGFSLVGWFPLEHFSACRGWKVGSRVTLDMIQPAEWLDDQERLLLEGERIADDILRGACPTQVAFPAFLPAALGCPVRVLPDTVLPEERKLGWEEALSATLDPANPWLARYLEFAEALVERSRGRFPVSHGAELGPVDLHAVLRGHNESILDLIDEPERSAELLELCGRIFTEFTEAVWSRLPLYHGGYFDAQYQLWAPGPIIRMQEDETAAYSPDLYRRLVQPVDRWIASRFPCAFMHVHSTSLHLLEAFLEIEEIRCFEVNIEPFNLPAAEMIPHLQAIQRAGRSLLVRGTLTEGELSLYLHSLDPAGLYLHLMVEEEAEVEALQRAAGMLWRP